MSARAVGSLCEGLFRSKNPHAQPVRRHSKHEGGREGPLWAAHNMFPRSEHNARMAAAQRFEHETKEPGKRNGALGHIGLEILRFMLRLRGRKDGRLDPSLRWLAQHLHRARSAVAAAMARLKKHGFIAWERRTRPVDDPDRPDQYVEQITNAYYFQLPGKAAEQVRRMVRRASDAVRRIADDRRRDDKIATSTPEELIANVTDPEMRATLHALYSGVESANPLNGQRRAL